MKNLYTLALAIFASGFAFGQVVHIHLDSDQGTMLNGTTLNQDVDQTTGFAVHMHVTNISGSAVNWKFGREIIAQSTTFTDQFCDDFLCYNCSGNIWVGSSVTPLANGDSSTFKPQIDLPVGATATIRYFIYDADNADAKVDSVDINYNSVLSLDKIDISFSSYPNPADQEFYLNFQGNEGVNFKLVVYNVVGEEVLVKTLNNGLNKINVEDLSNGVYFYSVVTKNEIIETKKLVVRH